MYENSAYLLNMHDQFGGLEDEPELLILAARLRVTQEHKKPELRLKALQDRLKDLESNLSGK
jgi:hypothetical protein